MNPSSSCPSGTGTRNRIKDVEISTSPEWLDFIFTHNAFDYPPLCGRSIEDLPKKGAEMRRQDREIKDEELMESIIRRAPVCRIGLSEDNVPYIVPLNFGYKDNFLYFHSAKEGKKIDMIRKNNNVCFEVDIEHKLVQGENPCDWSMKYYSVIGFGKAFLVEDYEEKRGALDIISEHYAGKSSFKYPEKTVNNIAIIKVKIEGMTGKKSGY